MKFAAECEQKELQFLEIYIFGKLDSSESTVVDSVADSERSLEIFKLLFE